MLAFGTGRYHRCEQQNSPESDSQQEFLRVWFDGMKPGYDARWFDRDSEWFRSFIASRTVWEDLWEATSAAPPPVDSDAFTTLEAVLVLDQVPRSLFPASPRAFASDDRALKVAREALEQGKDMELPYSQRVWMYMPLLHSERLADQETCVRAMEEIAARFPAAEPFHQAAVEHHRAVAKFGRLPERNRVLGRPSTAEELHWLRAHPTA